MEQRKLGRFEVSVVGLGCNNFGMKCDESQTADVVGAALDAGINFFDTADIYGAGMSETFLGKALGSKRDEIVLATKFGAPMSDDPEMRGGRPEWIVKAVEASLERLDTDRIDLYQLHFPDDRYGIEVTLEALDRLVKAGKVLEIGCSNFSAEQIDAATAASSGGRISAFVSVQNHYSLLHRDPEPEVVEACVRHGLGLIPYFPLASGFLTGKYRRGEPAPDGTRLSLSPDDRRSKIMTDANFDIIEKLEKFAADAGRTLVELAIGWLVAKKAVVSVIAGATKPSQIEANARGATWSMTSEEVAAIDAIAS